MAEKTKLKWLRKEFTSSEELEYYLTQLKHQDKLKSDIISLLERFQHLLFDNYEPDFLTIIYNGHWDVSFGPLISDEPKDRLKITSESLLPLSLSESDNEEAEMPLKLERVPTLPPRPEVVKEVSTPKKGSTTQKVAQPVNKKSNQKPGKTVQKLVGKSLNPPVPLAQPPLDTKTMRVDLKALIDAKLLAVGARLKHKNLSAVTAIVTREGHLKIGNNEYQSPSAAATSLAASGRRDGWLCWLFQDQDGEWKSIDLLREYWRENQAPQER